MIRDFYRCNARNILNNPQNGPEKLNIRTIAASMAIAAVRFGFFWPGGESITEGFFVNSGRQGMDILKNKKTT
jgi:hypothetical protein